MKKEIVSFTRRINGAYLATVVCTPSWFGRVILKRKPRTFELSIPKKIVDDRVTTAKIIHQFLNDNL